MELAKFNQISLTIFKPKKVVDFVFEEDTPTWDPNKLTRIKNQLNQLGLFDDNELRMTFKVVRKVLYKFYYRFEDVNGESSRMQILEWQIGALYWNCRQQAKDDKNQALAKVKQKYYDEFINKDLHFILGTTKQYHFVTRNPWMIIGVLPIPFEHQLKLL